MGDLKIAVIGGGSTGSAIIHDLASRGLDVTLIEKSTIGGGTSGRFHGLLHSGARYAVNDPKAAEESILDNQVISNIASHCVEDTGGVFLALKGDDQSFADKFESACKRAGIPIESIPIEKLIQEEPFINKDASIAFSVPDKIINSFRFITSLLLTAKSEGAKIRLGNEVVGFDVEDKTVKGVKVKDSISGETETLKFDLVINASGAWAEKILSDYLNINSIKMVLSAGTMAVVGRRFAKRVINRLRLPSDGDIVVPYFTESIIGTTSFIVDDPDNFEVDEDDFKFLLGEGAKLIPAIKEYGMKRYFAGVRPLIAADESESNDSRSISRDFRIFDHETTDGVSGIMTIVGGKLSTARLMGKQISDFVCDKLGIKTQSNTDKIKLLWPDISNDNVKDLSKSLSIPESLLKEILFETESKTYGDIYSPVKDLLLSKKLFS
ncbi:FAD-dependent oxidoreductase [Candidatus Parvarchaeota archaeon]|uniref:FAD-dependent oxidoreductase n=1 Tax=Candidatus Acidifodinimicrobium mancum TaxID=2898728 RepID=A0A8T3V0D5_9ARCH|nr:FAD-dependent oxidoreductase [Candidatus Acidifodinimicrobium mancum]MBE5728711.1 FAD-dependent oxidoreductase [Candidatus Acidifodinimicrobium mancum]MBE5730273.1 FAD-dependent oxidoreductase [Candidatus Acidifodinimicrobium mancum]